MKYTTSTDATLAQLMTRHDELHNQQDINTIDVIFSGATISTLLASLKIGTDLDSVHNQIRPMVAEINKVNIAKLAQQSAQKSFNDVTKEISAPREAHNNAMQELVTKNFNNQVLRDISKVGSPTMFGLKHIEPAVTEHQSASIPSPTKR